MVKKWTKAVSVSLCILLLASLTACKSSTKNATASTVSSAGSSATADPFGKYDSLLTINTVTSLDSNVKFDKSNPEQKSLTENLWATAYKDVLNIKFNYMWTPNYDEYDSKWNTAIASNDIPDCAVVDSTIYKELLEAGLVEDMTQTYNSYASDTYKKAITDSGSIELSYMTTNGKLYGLPFPGTTYDNVNLLFIRKDWLKKVNMTEPKTMDDLINVANAFVKAKLGGKDTYGICFSKGGGSSLLGGQNDLIGFFNSFGAYYDMWLDDGSGKLIYGNTQTSKWDSALTKLQEMYKDGIISQDFAVKDSATAGEDVASGKVGITYGTYWAPLGTMGDCMENNSKADWEVLLPPTSDGSDYVTQASASPLGYIFVKKGYAHPEAVVKVMNLNLKYNTEKYSEYGTTTAGVETFKYEFGQGCFAPWKNLTTTNLIAKALKSGDTSSFNGEQKQDYTYVKNYVDGKGKAVDQEYGLIFGTSSTYTLIGQMKENKKILVDADLTLPTDTQTSSGTNLLTGLNSAILKVIMGADVSTYDKAVSAWENGGGNTITTEINDWYAKSKK